MMLNDIEIDKEVIIKRINCSDSIKRRIMDLGIIEKTKIKPVFKSPLGEPIAYEVRGSLIALRKEETERIEVHD